MRALFLLLLCYMIKSYDLVVATCELKAINKPKKVQIGKNTSFQLSISNLRTQKSKEVSITTATEKRNIASTTNNVTLSINQSTAVVVIHGKHAGETYVTFNTNSSVYISNLHRFKVKVNVVHCKCLVIVNIVIGWIYFVAWSISFYPQVYINWSRKSVIGLNFDFVCYNLLGFFAYGVFNIGMFWIPKIKSEYHSDHPNDDEDPVEANDVFFSIHALLLTIITAIQILIYERGQQVVSKLCKILVSVSVLSMFITLLLTIFTDELNWLDYLYCFSYVKIAMTLIKYVPQAYMNFRRKSTVGWSIGNVLLDFTGGSFSILQMIILSYNNNAWVAIFGDLTKFSLGLISVLFDILFMVQHYILYPQRKQLGYERIQDEANHHSGRTAAPT
ncbi:cystinosin-like [Xenia sp. Carnegie-2017]|uniref:cystinosin-like n=1 Tax=Xenia sp. Carnegie-2017 TaxID=2897299 RepID=UPI001F049A0B|nr:cystinosin-like [Xenia sp. Carnegie-2017]